MPICDVLTKLSTLLLFIRQIIACFSARRVEKIKELELHQQLEDEKQKVEKNAEKLWHAMSGAAYVKYVLGIDDDELITAIRYHTTAREGMTQLEKLLYLADFTSADRDYDDIDIMRQKVEISMEAALDYALSYTINDLVSRNKPLHIDTVKAYNENALKGNV